MKNLKPVTLSRLILLLITIFILTLFVTGCITNNKHEPPGNGTPTVQSSPVPPGKGTLIPQTSPQNKPSNSGLYPWGKNISLFLLGAMGALLTIYLGDNVQDIVHKNNGQDIVQ